VRRARSCRSTPVVLLLPLLLLPLFGFPGISDTLSRQVNSSGRKRSGIQDGREREREREREKER